MVHCAQNERAAPALSFPLTFSMATYAPEPVTADMPVSIIALACDPPDHWMVVVKTSAQEWITRIFISLWG